MRAPMREPAGDDLAIVIGPGKGGSRPPGRGMMHSEPDADERGGPSDMDGDEMLPPGFEAAASEAFPDMDPANYPALKRLIASCMSSGSEGGY